MPGAIYYPNHRGWGNCYQPDGRRSSSQILFHHHHSQTMPGTHCYELGSPAAAGDQEAGGVLASTLRTNIYEMGGK